MTFDSLGVILKLVSGETVICQVLSDTDKNMIVKDPYIINVVSQKVDDGIRAMTYYSDWFMGATSRIHMIRKDHVISAAIPDSAVKKDYASLIDQRNHKESNPETKKSDAKFNWEDLNYKIDDDDSSRN